MLCYMGCRWRLAGPWCIRTCRPSSSRPYARTPSHSGPSLSRQPPTSRHDVISATLSRMTIVLQIVVPPGSRGSAWASMDGRNRQQILPGGAVTVCASPWPVSTVNDSPKADWSVLWCAISDDVTRVQVPQHIHVPALQRPHGAAHTGRPPPRRVSSVIIIHSALLGRGGTCTWMKRTVAIMMAVSYRSQKREAERGRRLAAPMHCCAE